MICDKSTIEDITIICNNKIGDVICRKSNRKRIVAWDDEKIETRM